MYYLTACTYILYIDYIAVNLGKSWTITINYGQIFVAETKLDAVEGSNRGSRRRGVKRLDALTHTAIAYAATSP
jgi:hypothetical protein